MSTRYTSENLKLAEDWSGQARPHQAFGLYFLPVTKKQQRFDQAYFLLKILSYTSSKQGSLKPFGDRKHTNDPHNKNQQSFIQVQNLLFHSTNAQNT